MSNRSGESNFIEYITNQQWLLPVLMAVYFVLLGSMVLLSEDLTVTAALYANF